MAEVLARCGAAALPCSGRRGSILRPSAVMSGRSCAVAVPIANQRSPSSPMLGSRSQRFESLKTSFASPSPQIGGRMIGRSPKWWEKGLQPNMKEIASAQDLVDSLLAASEDLVVVDFFSPGCAGCRALHPKICQFAEMHPEVQFLQVNYEEHKSMCYSLHVHVLPFFRFYRGAHGRLCSFSCTNATVKKFKDALAKHGTARCSLGPTKGLEESELLALAANKDLLFSHSKVAPQLDSRLVPPVKMTAPSEEDKGIPVSSS